MSKSILIVICDFLLLSLLSMVSFEGDQSIDVEKVPSREDAEMVSLLKTALDSEMERMRDLDNRVNELSKLSDIRQSEADEHKSLLQRRDKELKKLVRIKENLEKEKQEILSKSKDLEKKVANIKSRDEKMRRRILEATSKYQKSSEDRIKLEKELSEMKVVDTESKVKLLSVQSELKRHKDQLDSLEKENEQLKEENKVIETEKLAFSTQLELAKVKSQIYEENLRRTEAQISLEKKEKEKILESTGMMVVASEKLEKSIESLKEKTGSEIYEVAKESFVDIEMRYVFDGLLSSASSTTKLRGIYVRKDSEHYILFSGMGTFFEPSYSVSNMPKKLSIFYGDEKFEAKSLYVFSIDNSILGIKASPEILNKKSINQAEDFFRFKNCTVIDKNRPYYGVVPYSVDAENGNIAKLNIGLFSSLFGDFRPSDGGFVFSGTGNFLGFMINSDYAILMRSYAILKELKLGKEYKHIDSFMEDFSTQYKTKPLRLR